MDSVSSRSFGTDDAWFLAALANVLGLALYRRVGLQRGDEAAANGVRTLSQEQILREELSHRRKNDLQLILSMLIMQKRRLADEQARRGVDEVMDWVAAVSMASRQGQTR